MKKVLVCAAILSLLSIILIGYSSFKSITGLGDIDIGYGNQKIQEEIQTDKMIGYLGMAGLIISAGSVITALVFKIISKAFHL